MQIYIAVFMIGGLMALVTGGELLVRGASKLAFLLRIPSVIIGLTIVAFGTSAPELAVSLEAGLNGNPDISVSNAVGSNIFNLLFILGLSGLILPLIIDSQILRRELPFLIIISFLFYLFSIDLVLSRMEGAILFLILLVYTLWLIYEWMNHKNKNQNLILESETEYELKEEKSVIPIITSVLFVVSGLTLVMFGARWIVQGSVSFAQLIGVSEIIIGLTIVAGGTSLPELVASLVASYRGEREIAIGNIIGSNIFNILAILGLTSIISPNGLPINNQIVSFDLPLMIGITLVAYPLFRSGKTFSRFEGFIFFTAYFLYTFYLISISI